jgi:nucleoid-associated protein YgaU
VYRALILVTAFLIAVSGLLFLQGEGRDSNDLAAAGMTLTDVRDMNTPTVVQPAVGSDLDLSLLSSAVEATGTSAAQGQVSEMDALVSSVLAGLGAAPASPAPVPDEMRAATNAVLAALSGGAGQTPGGSNDLATLISQSMAAGQGDAYLDALVNEAVASGQVMVPEAMMTADGRVDTRTLIASVVSQSLGSGGAVSATQPVTQEVGGQRYYTVEAGDSLAYISVLFYGTSAQFQKIFDANRSVLESPNKIRVGQTLLIPG